jgi:LmbE family N-acetylglucosaminyl deacetylase
MHSSTRLPRPKLPETWTAPPKGSVLVLAPHPDDETCGAGGALALHRRQGDRVKVLFLTDGMNGDPEQRHGTKTELAALRRTEAGEAAKRLGGLAVEFFGLPDDFEVTEEDLAAVGSRIAAALSAERPHVVYVPWEGESHSDHRNTRLALDRALERAAKPPWVLEYEVWSPLPADVVLDITDVVPDKRAALEAHASQMGYSDYRHHMLGLNAHRSIYLPRGRTHGEAFRIGGRP